MSTEKLSITMVLIATICSAIIIFIERALPFILFRKKTPPSFISFIEKYIPPMVMAILLFYCLKDVNFSSSSHGIPYIIALTTTVLLHLWKRNSLISIFGGTILFMVLNFLL